MRKPSTILVLALYLTASAAFGQAGARDEIREILKDSDFWMNKEVTVEAFVRDIQVLDANFVHYKLEDFAGDEIWVKKETGSNADHPELHQKVVVTGVVRRNSDFNVTESETLLFEKLAPPPPVVQEEPEPRPWWQENMLLVLLLAVFFVLFIALVLVLLWPSLSRKPVVATQATIPPPPPAGMGMGVPQTDVAGAPTVVAGAPTAVAGAPAPIDELPTPVYQGSVGTGEMPTPLYYGHLTVEESSEANLVGKSFDLAFPGGKPEALLGRSNQADIKIPHKYLSRRHLRIQHKDGKLLALKVPGAKDVQINGNPLDEQYGALLETGSVITFPGIAFKVDLG